MDFATIIEMIGSVGFPLVAVLIMGWFIFKIYNDTQAKGQERENKLYEEIKLNREISAQAITTIGMYADRLKNIEQDINEIKTDITVIMNK